MDYLEYVTSEGDRWDLLAYSFYGSAYKYEPLIVVNPAFARSPILPSGVKLKIPVLPVEQVRPANLPPWKR
jgi:phage tail protein X